MSLQDPQLAVGVPAADLSCSSPFFFSLFAVSGRLSLGHQQLQCALVPVDALLLAVATVLDALFLLAGLLSFVQFRASAQACAALLFRPFWLSAPK